MRRSKQRRGGAAEGGFRSGYVTLEGLEEKSNEQQVCRSGAEERGSNSRATSVHGIVESLGMDQITQRERIEWKEKADKAGERWHAKGGSEEGSL